MQPILKIGDFDCTEHIANDGLSLSTEDLDADGSGRDVYTGLMYRTKIASKDTLEVSMLPMLEGDVKSLRAALNDTYLTVTFLDPASNTQKTEEMYCSSVNYGSQFYSPSAGKTRYVGLTFNLIER